MAHHTYPPGTPTGVVPVNYVVPESDWSHVLAALYKSINGDEGGTWAPSGFITVGGSGFSFTGTGHQIAASARVTIQSTGEMRVANGGLIRLDGSAGDIELKVTSNTALIDVGNGAAVRILAGGSLDIIGTMAVSAAGPGNVTWATSTTAVFNSGSTLTLAAGADMAATGTITLAGQIIVTSVGDITVSSGGIVLGVSGATLTWQGTVDLSDLTLVGASVWPELSTARTIQRKATKCIPLTYSNGGGLGPLDDDVWESRSPAATTPCWRYRKYDASGKFSLLEITGLPIGAIITGASITAGGSELGSVSSTLPNYQIVSWVTGLAAYATHSSLTVDAAASPLGFATTASETTITATGSASSRTVDETRRYGIYVEHPYEAVNDQGMYVYNAYITATVDVIRY